MGNFPVSNVHWRVAISGKERGPARGTASTAGANVAIFAWFEIPCPGGAFENSPAFQRRDLCADCIRPEGTAETHREISGWIRPNCANPVVPSGLGDLD